MSSQLSTKNKNNPKSKIINKEEKDNDNQENNIKFIKRTLKNNTHQVIEDTRLKSITSWRKSQTKFLQNLIFNLLSFGILHLVSLFYPKLYLKLYCNPWPPKECDYFLVENIYGNFTLCPKIYKKSKKSQNTSYNYDFSKENPSSSLVGMNYKMEHFITRNLTYSFKYKSVTYEYNEETNEISPVYLDLSRMTNKGIFNFFGEGLSTESILKKFEERYGKNEYIINLKLPYFYFKKIEILYFIFIIILQAIKLIFNDETLFIIFLAMCGALVVLELILNKIMIHDLFEKEYTLDGESTKIKVKRNHKLINSPDFFYEIKNCDLLPGDVVYLKNNDLVPCDCLILEGECIVNENNLTGSLDTFKKKSLENNNEQFNYESSKHNILYHGMKIVKAISKSNNGYISVLCINTGPNTFKANQLSNILYLLERKKEYKIEYDILGGTRKNAIFLIIGIIFLTVIFAIVMPTIVDVSFNLNDSNKVRILITSSVRIFIRSCLPVLFLTNSIIYFVGIIHLKNENIFCFEKSKLTIPGNINTVFFGKTGILSENKLEINGYHPIYIKANNIYYRTYKESQSKEMNTQLLKYYKNYLNKCQNSALNQDFNPRQTIKMERNQNNLNKENYESNECVALFLECLLCCNNVEKYNSEIFGNSIETTIFRNMKWDLKSYRFNNNDINNKSKDMIENDSYINEVNSDNNKYNYDSNSNLIDRNINDIYPNNYFKITESFNKEIELQNKPIITRFNSKYYLDQMKKNNNNNNPINSNSNIREFSIEQNSNFIKNDISKNRVLSYKLRIYKKFIANGSLNSSAIVYNFITKELRFMTKGIPENILDKCDRTTLPDNFYNTISLFRKKGLIIIVCAYKIISLEDYRDSASLDEYMNNLNFCGFISLKNKLKEEVINSIKDLRQFDCKLIISTGDNVFNCLPIGFDSNILENKNVFNFDKEENKNKLVITKIYSVKKESEEEQDDKTQKSSFDKLSRNTLSSKVLSSSMNKTKDTVSIKGKKENSKNADESSTKQGNEENFKNLEKKIYSPNNRHFRGNFNRNKKSSNNLAVFGKRENEKKNNKNYTDVKIPKKEMTENSKNMILINLEKNLPLSNIKNSRNNKYSINNNEYQGSSTSRKIVNKSESKNKFFSYLEKYNYYPSIFEDIKELTDNCIYCISGRAFNFLYQNKEKKQCKKILEKMYKNCKIYYNMTSLDKSHTIDFYREHNDCCVCYIGKESNDFDAIMTSNVGINLNAPKNENTILCHFYAVNSSILSLKKIIREGRAISENILLLTITCVFYSLILNTYIICYLFFKIDIVKGQINFLEVFFVILSVSAFTVQYDQNTTSNKLMQNKKLYFYHYVFQIVGTFIIKLFIIFSLYKFYTKNGQLDIEKENYIFATYYFILCVEQLFSIFYVLNYISFYRKHPLNNGFFVLFNLLLVVYFINLISLNSSNYKLDFFSITNFEFNENLIDSYDDNNRLKCFWICIVDSGVCFIYTKIIFFIFDALSKKI